MEAHIKLSEVKFLDYFKMNISEGILQVRACQSRTKLGDRRRSDTVVVSTVNYADYELDIVLCSFLGSGFVPCLLQMTSPAHYKKLRVFGFRGEYSRKAET